ncbi:MAG: hypothetical protein HFH50_15455 [Lachnospiraceae bacterium]|jgi:hypothetical protein|nr:hypothetical protein [Lachnospiraceae bacterium]GFI29204.1 hypothetical protein IMSAGC013_00588 [Lachnospiraceae bacterium]
MVYRLILTDRELSYDNYSQDFLIGFFLTQGQAEETARYYLENVQGFCEYDCTYGIVKKEIADNPDHIAPKSVWFVQGWNTNEYLDEIDIVESPCFLTEERAQEECRLMQRANERTEWAVSCYCIGDLHWKDGFVRV